MRAGVQSQIYQAAVPISARRHIGLSVEMGATFEFADGLNAVPIALGEVHVAVREFVIVFAGDDDLLPAVLLSLRPGMNLHVTGDGEWSGGYIPAYLRQYPFVSAVVDDTDGRHVLCIDESYPGCNSEGRGLRLFDDDGAQTTFLRDRAAWSGRFLAELKQTREAVRQLTDLSLLVPMTAQAMDIGGSEIVLTGFSAISSDRLAELGGDQLVMLRDAGLLALVYLHLQSLDNVGRLARRDATIARPRPADTDFDAIGSTS